MRDEQLVGPDNRSSVSFYEPRRPGLKLECIDPDLGLGNRGSSAQITWQWMQFGSRGVAPPSQLLPAGTAPMFHVQHPPA